MYDIQIRGAGVKVQVQDLSANSNRSQILGIFLLGVGDDTAAAGCVFDVLRHGGTILAQGAGVNTGDVDGFGCGLWGHDLVDGEALARFDAGQCGRNGGKAEGDGRDFAEDDHFGKEFLKSE